MLSRKEKIAIIGAGNVGEAVGYTLMLKKQASDIVFIDLDEKRAEGSALDIAHATTFAGQAEVRRGGYDECADADIIVITAGARRKPGQTRLDLAKTNVSIITGITKSIMEYATNPIIIVVSNPVDLNTYVVQKVSGLPANQVIGTGTTLDTARFRSMIAEQCGVDVNDVMAFILGEHGDSQCAIWSNVTIAGEDIKSFLAANPEIGELDYDEITAKTRDAGAVVIANKGATVFGIAMSTTKIIEAIRGNDKTIMPVSHVIQDEFKGVKDLAISVPCMLDRTGICKVLDYSMNDQELAAFKASADTLRKFVDDTLAQ